MNAPTCICDRCRDSVPYPEIESVPGPEGEMFVCGDCAAERNGLVKGAIDKATKLWASRAEVKT